MRSPMRWFRRYAELRRLAPRRRTLEADLTALWGAPCTLIPASTKGGYDQIYYAVGGGVRRAVVRVNNPYKTQHDPIGPRDPGVPLGSAARLAREWDAYSRLFPRGLSPQPLWRTEDAITCAWLDGQRASDVLASQHARVWTVGAAVLQATRRMHDAGVVHLDLNLGNFLLCGPDAVPAVIDFEFGPVDWVTPDQQMAFDYLRVIDDLLRPRRGGRVLLTDPGRLVSILRDTVPVPVRAAAMGFAFDKLRHLARQPALCNGLTAVFRNLQQA